jgi:hypothetical protein
MPRTQLAYAVWQSLRENIIFDGPRLQRLTDRVTAELWAAGVRFVEDEDVARELEHDALQVIGEMDSLAANNHRLRVKIIAAELAASGWRKIGSTAAVVLLAVAV